MKNERRIYPITNDYAFKLLFKDKRIAVDYINSFLGLSINEDDVIDCNPQIKHSLHQKGSEFDVRIVLKGGSRGFDIENQVAPTRYPMEKRLIHYAAKQYVDLLNTGDEYDKEVESYVLCFCDYELNNKEAYDYITLYSHTYAKSYKDIQIKIISLKEIAKYDNIDLRKRLEILTTTDFKKYLNEEGVVGIMAKKMNEINEDEKIRIELESQRVSVINYNRALAAEKKYGLEEGIKQGIEQGIEQRSIEIAKNLKSMNMDIASIASATGLSIEEIKKL